MYLPDDQGKYVPKVGVLSFSVQGLSDALMALDTVTEVQPPSGEFALQLKVMMAYHPAHPCPPTFSWNVGMVLHVLKSDPTLRDLEHIQVDGTGRAYLFFFNKQGHRGLTLEAAHAMRAHVGEVFSEWISYSVHFAVNPMPLAEDWHHVMVASERHRQWSWVEYPGRPVLNLASRKLDSTLPLVGSAPCPCKDRSSRRHSLWMGCKGASKSPTRKASQAPTSKGVFWKLTPILS